MAISRDGSCAVSGSADKTLKLWDVATGRELATVPLSWIPAQLVWSKGGDNHVYSANRNGTVSVFDRNVYLRPAKRGQQHTPRP